MATKKEETKTETKKVTKQTEPKKPVKKTETKKPVKKTETKKTAKKTESKPVEKKTVKKTKPKKPEAKKPIKVENKMSNKAIEELNIKENIVSIILYLIYILIGVFTMYFPEIVMISPMHYVGIVFYLLAIFNISTYFIIRKRSNYQRLFTGLINVSIGSICFLSNMKPLEFALGTVILLFSLLLVVNLSYTIYITKEESSRFVKFVIVFLIGFLSTLTIINLYNGLSAAPFMLGYYILSIGIMLIIEPIIYLILPVSKLEKIFKTVLNEKNSK